MAAPNDLIEVRGATSTAPIDVARIVNYVRQDGDMSASAGAIATFEGITRGNSNDRRVTELRFDGDETMVTERLNAACAAARVRWQLIRIAVSRRLGVVPVGETIVFVAVSAVHQSDAVEAARFVIGGLPICKTEMYEDGGVREQHKYLDTEAAHCCCGREARLAEV